MEQLVRTIEARTGRQVRNLQVHCRGRSVRVTGLSRSYYVKQLVTHAILSAVPLAVLENDITVHAT